MENKMCSRCGSENNLEVDHIIPKSKGGTDDVSNKRILCEACHDYRHARDKIIFEINCQRRLVGTSQFNSAKLTMWIMRLGILEAFNTPEELKQSEKYKAYWDFPETHYNRWSPLIKMAKENRLKRPAVTLEEFV